MGCLCGWLLYIVRRVFVVGWVFIGVVVVHTVKGVIVAVVAFVSGVFMVGDVVLVGCL